MTARKKGEDKYFVLYLCSTLIVLPSFLNLYIFFQKIMEWNGMVLNG